MGPSATISEYLNIVEIKCEVVDERVLKVLEFLSTFNICKLSCHAPHSSIYISYIYHSLHFCENVNNVTLYRKH